MYVRMLAGAAVCAALLGAVGCSSSTDPKSATSLSDSCINPTFIDKQEIVSDSEIRFTMDNGEVWTNKMAFACPGLKFEQAFSWEVRGTLVCSNEQLIRTRDGAICQLGEFSRVEPSAS